MIYKQRDFNRGWPLKMRFKKRYFIQGTYKTNILYCTTWAQNAFPVSLAVIVLPSKLPL